MKKQELEKRIVEARSKLNVSNEDLGWLSSKEFVELIDAFSNLFDYSSRHDEDTTYIYFEVVNAYLELTRFLNLLLRYSKFPEDEERIEGALAALEYLMDCLIGAGFRQLNNPPNVNPKR